PSCSLGLSSGQFPFGLAVLRFRLYQTVSGSDFLGAFQVSASAFPFPASPTLSEVFVRTDRPLVSDSSGGLTQEIAFARNEEPVDFHRCPGV
ncbi:hypothetical protein WB401_04600, partial [Streptomyces brasiliscabiei]